MSLHIAAAYLAAVEFVITVASGVNSGKIKFNNDNTKIASGNNKIRDGDDRVRDDEDKVRDSN